MLSIDEHPTVSEASQALLPFILHPKNWVALEGLAQKPGARPGENAAYQRQVGVLRICASVDVTPALSVFLRIAFRAPHLTPMKAADHLEAFLSGQLPLVPYSEWHVQVDERRWVHFIHRWVGEALRA
jgi:hypothetical protein